MLELNGPNQSLIQLIQAMSFSEIGDDQLSFLVNINCVFSSSILFQQAIRFSQVGPCRYICGMNRHPVS